MLLGAVGFITLFVFQMFSADQSISSNEIISLKECISNSPVSYNYSLQHDGQLAIILNEQREYDSHGKDLILSSCLKKYANDAHITIIKSEKMPTSKNNGELNEAGWKNLMSTGIARKSHSQLKNPKDTTISNPFEYNQGLKRHEGYDYDDSNEHNHGDGYNSWSSHAFTGEETWHASRPLSLIDRSNTIDQPVPSASISDSEQTRAPIYEAFASEYEDDCRSVDRIHCITDKCYNFSNAFRAIKFYSDDADLRGFIYFHHKCRGSKHPVEILLGEYTKCFEQTTYSWKMTTKKKKPKRKSFIHLLPNFIEPVKNAYTASKMGFNPNDLKLN